MLLKSLRELVETQENGKVYRPLSGLPSEVREVVLDEINEQGLKPDISIPDWRYDGYDRDDEVMDIYYFVVNKDWYTVIYFRDGKSVTDSGFMPGVVPANELKQWARKTFR